MKIKRIIALLCNAVLFMIAISGAVVANNKPLQDSVIVNFGQGSQMIILLNSPEDAKMLKKVDFEQVIIAMNIYLDSAKNAQKDVLKIEDATGSYEVRTNDRKKPFFEKIGMETESGLLGLSKEKGTEKKPKEKLKIHSWPSRVDFKTSIDLGFNNFFEDGSIPSGTDYDLRPAGARYAAIGLNYHVNLGPYRHGPLFLKAGLAFSFYNFMFDGQRRIGVQGNQPFFYREDEFTLDKTKLSASYALIPVMLKYQSRDGFRLGAGAYAGYRLQSHTKVKYDNNQKERQRGNYGLNNFRYGITGEIGYGGLVLFGNMDLSSLFTPESQMPDLQAFSFGIRL